MFIPVELGKRFFPRCSSLLDKVMDETEPASLGIGRDTPSVKRKFQDLRYFLLKAFKDDKEEFDRSVLLTSCRCPLDQGV
jgi:regulatory protein NPR1